MRPGRLVDRARFVVASLALLPLLRLSPNAIEQWRRTHTDPARSTSSNPEAVERMRERLAGMTRVKLSGRLICRDETEAAIVAAYLLGHIERTRAEWGCLAFDVVTTDDPLVWSVTEEFADSPAFASHQARTTASEWGQVTAAIERSYEISGFDESEVLDDWHVIRFFNDYSAGHPLWQADGQADLQAFCLSAELTGRLEAWSDYWERQMRWEHGWTPGPLDDWFDSEGDALPRDLAAELGSAFAVDASYGRVCSADAPTNPAAAAALERQASRELALERAFAEDRAAGAVFDVQRLRPAAEASSTVHVPEADAE